MQYLIDGHNLIPKLGLGLDLIDDEMELISRLEEFCRLRRSQVEVYFDGAPPGQPSKIKSGVVTAHFVRAGSTADQAIEIRLAGMGKAAKNWTVVSSDQRVQRAAGAVHAHSLSSEEFSTQIKRAKITSGKSSVTDTVLNPDEVDEWLDFFKKRGR